MSLKQTMHAEKIHEQIKVAQKRPHRRIYIHKTTENKQTIQQIGDIFAWAYSTS